MTALASAQASAVVEPTAADRALERLITSLMARVEVLEGQAARGADDTATALAAVTGHGVRLATLEMASLTGAILAKMEAPFTQLAHAATTDSSH